ncbi:MAG: hypothetical protein KC583_19245 [Myxococcales bacterium]|nr:hypothetical protein [Myxococcales bacterium]
MTTKAPHVVVEPRSHGGYSWHTSDGWAGGSVFHCTGGGWMWQHDDGYGGTSLQPDGEPAYRWPREALRAGLVSFQSDVWAEHFDAAWRVEWGAPADALTIDDRAGLARVVDDHGWAGLRAIVTREANRAALEHMTPAQLAAMRAREYAEEMAAILRRA